MAKLRWAVAMAGLLGCGPVVRPDAGVTTDAGALDSLGFVRALTRIIPAAPAPQWGTELSTEFLNPDDFICSREEIEGCFRYQCKSSVATFGPRTTAGTVRLSSPSLSHLLDPNDAGNYGFRTGIPAAWAAGDPLQIAASGSDGGVPPFSAELVGPGKIVVTSPSGFDSASFPEVSVDTPYRVTWTGGADATVAVFISAGGPLGMSLCTAPGAAGTLEVPTALLRQLRGSNGFISIGAESHVELNAGRWTVLAIALWCGEAPGGSAFTSASFH